MKGYLFDTNVVSDWFDSTRPRHKAVSEKVAQCARAGALLVTSTVVLGEIEYGIHTAPADKRAPLDALRA